MHAQEYTWHDDERTAILAAQSKWGGFLIYDAKPAATAPDALWPAAG
jgi:hypothetical protein